MRAKGRMKYVPPEVLEMLKLVKQNNGTEKDSEAFREITEHAKIGLAIRNFNSLFLGKPKRKKK